MKGLLIKDFKLLSQQTQFIIAIFGISVAFLVIWESPFFVMGYATSMVSIFTLSTISYDQYENGMAYLFTLPFSRKDYVREKYVFGILISLTTMIAVSALAFGAAEIRHLQYSVEEGIGTMIGSILLVMIIMGILIPLQLKFEAEKSRVALLLTLLGVLLVGYLIVKVGEGMGIDMDAAIGGLLGVGPVQLIAEAVLVSAVVIGISYIAAIKVMAKKEL